MNQDQVVSTLRRAAGELAKRCDGARSKDDEGFNAIDTKFGKRLASLPEAEWTEGTVATARRMLNKYQDQLEGYGVDLSRLPGPEELTTEAAPTEGERPDWWTSGGKTEQDRAERRGGAIVLRFRYEEHLVEEVKRRAKGRRYDRGLDAWLLHLNAQNVALTEELQAREGWRVGEDLEEVMKEMSPEAAGKGRSGGDSEEDMRRMQAKEKPLESGTTVEIEFEYEPELIGEIKGRLVPRSWTGEVWETDINPRNAYVLLELIADWGFEVGTELMGVLQEEAEGIWSERQAKWSAETERAVLLFPPTDELLGQVKGLARRSYVPKEEGGPHWEVPLTVATAENLVELLGEKEFQVEERLWEAIEGFAQRAERRIRLSGWARGKEANGKEINGRTPDGEEGNGNDGEATSGLRSFGRPMPVEKELDYDLYPYQRAGVQYARETSGVIIGDQMGLGKTITALATIHSEEAYPLLVVCPATVKSNWIREAHQCLPAEKKGISLSMLEGMDPSESGETTIRVDDGRISVPTCDLEADIITTNYAILGPYVEALKERGLGSIVIDESHKVKNREAKRSQRCAELAEETDHQILLTGTPVRNRPKEIFNQLRLIGAAGEESTPFGEFFPWAKRYCNATKTRWGWDFSGATNTEELNRSLRATCYVRRKKTAVAKELPDVQEEEVGLDISNRKEYDRAERDVLHYLRNRLKSDPEYFQRVSDYLGWEEEATPENPAGLIDEKIRRSQRAEHLVKASVLREVSARGKEDAVVHWASDVIEGGEKLLLFAVHRPMQRLLIDSLSEHDPAHIFAADSSEERERQIERFQEERECRVMIASLGAAKEGVDGLQEACSIVGFTELPWSPADLDQATARLHRMGQVEMVNSYHLIANRTIDEQIRDLIQEKRSVVDQATEGDLEGADGVLSDLKPASNGQNRLSNRSEGIFHFSLPLR